MLKSKIIEGDLFTKDGNVTKYYQTSSPSINPFRFIKSILKNIVIDFHCLPQSPLLQTLAEFHKAKTLIFYLFRIKLMKLL